MNTLNRLSAPKLRARDHTRLVLLALLLAILAGCAPASKYPDAQPAVEVVVTRLDDGRQGFQIDERAEMDGATLSAFTRAGDFMGQARYDEAIALLQQVIEYSPRLTAPHIVIALAYEQKGETEEAEEHLKSALVMIPGHPVASNAYGLLLRKNGRFAEAREIFEMSLERFPDYLPVRKNLGILCELYLGDLDTALEQFEIYSAAAPEDDLVKIWIASLRQRIERQK